MIIKKNVLPRMLTNISHVPEIAKKLFCVCKITSQGHIFEFKNKKMYDQKYPQRGSWTGHVGKSALQAIMQHQVEHKRVCSI